MELEIAKPTEGGTEEVKRIHSHTTPEAAYSEEGVGKVISDKQADLEARVNARADHQVGSGWTMKKHNEVHVIDTPRHHGPQIMGMSNGPEYFL